MTIMTLNSSSECIFEKLYSDIVESGRITDFLDKFSWNIIPKNAVLIFTQIYEHIMQKNVISSNINQLIFDCDIILDYIWELINIGSWKLVKYEFRYMFGLSSLFKAMLLSFNNNCDYQEIIKVCDLGLIMCPPFANNIIAEIASYIHQMYISKLSINEVFSVLDKIDNSIEIKICDKNRAIPRIKCPSIEEFELNFFSHKKPVIIENAMDYWPCFNDLSSNKWCLEYLLKTAGFRTVIVEIGSKYTDNDWSQKLMTIRDIIKEFFKSNSETKGYVAQQEIFDQITELSKDFFIPDYCCLDEEGITNSILINGWFGPKNTISPLHFDSYENIFAQVFGSKYIRLYKDSVYPYSENLLSNTSMVDINNIDYNKFPTFDEIPYLENNINAGELLYIPRGYWHYVQSLSISFSISFWWNFKE